MENYSDFRQVMLHLEVGYQCVTHPFAMPHLATARRQKLEILNSKLETISKSQCPKSKTFWALNLKIRICFGFRIWYF